MRCIVDQNYRELDVWKKSVALITELYRLTSDFGDAERLGLASEIRKAANSIANNIAEGWARQSTGDYVLHWTVARSAMVELGTHLTVAYNLGYFKADDYAAVSEPLQDIGKMLGRLIAILKSQAKTTGRGAPCPVAHVPCPINQPAIVVSRTSNT
jgi:four helix bundle protein